MGDAGTSENHRGEGLATAGYSCHQTVLRIILVHHFRLLLVALMGQWLLGYPLWYRRSGIGALLGDTLHRDPLVHRVIDHLYRAVIAQLVGAAVGLIRQGV